MLMSKSLLFAAAVSLTGMSGAAFAGWASGGAVTANCIAEDLPAGVLPAGAGTITQDCAHRDLAYPLFRQRPSFNVECTVQGTDTRAHIGTNSLMALARAETDVCEQGKEIEGADYCCRYVPI